MKCVRFNKTLDNETSRIDSLIAYSYYSTSQKR